jgi:outer membrane protein TolC
MKPLTFFFFATLAYANPVHVDLPTVMKLAGANNDEIELAHAKHTQAVAESKLVWQQFWPSLTLGAGYRRTDGNVQDIAGAVFDVSKQQYTVGPNIVVDWSPGDMYYAALAAKQRALATHELAEKARRDIVMQATGRYYDLRKTDRWCRRCWNGFSGGFASGENSGQPRKARDPPASGES